MYCTNWPLYMYLSFFLTQGKLTPSSYGVNRVAQMINHTTYVLHVLKSLEMAEDK